jgi:hypothetical protein
MKFTALQVKEKILAKLGNTRKLSDRSVDEMIASAMAFAGEETELADFLKNAEPMFVTANGNLIKEQSDFVKDWELKNPKPTPTPTPTPTPPVTPTGGLTAEEVAAIVARSLEPFASKLGEIDTQRTTESIFTQAQNAFLADNKLDLSNERVKMIKDRVFTTVKSKVGKDSKVEEVSAAMKAEFDDLVKIAGVDTPYVPAEPSGGAGGAEGTAEFYRAQRQQLEKEGYVTPTPGQVPPLVQK